MKTNANLRGARGRQGHALVTSVIILASLMLFSYAFVRVVTRSQKEVASSLDDGRALCLAEAGLNEAYEAIRSGATGNIGTADAPAYLGGGVLWVAATDLGNDRRRLVSTAMVGSGRKALEVVIEYTGGEPPLFNTTLNSKEQLTLNEGVLIDSFDSSMGDYTAQAVNTTNGLVHANQNGDVRSNENIVLNARASVFGDAIPGPAGTVSFATDSYVSGDTTSASEPFSFPAIEIPTYPPSGPRTVPNGATQSLGPGNFDFDSLSINKDATLIIRGPTNIVASDFVGGRSAKLIIDATAGPVTINVENTYTHNNGFEASALPGSPMALAFMIDGTTDVVFPNTTMVRGAYYAPNANIVFSSSSECWGAFAAKRIDMSNSMKFHFDEVLADYWKSDGSGADDGFEELSWTPTAVTPSGLLADRRDPMAILGVKRADLLSPSQIWAPEADGGQAVQ